MKAIRKMRHERARGSKCGAEAGQNPSRTINLMLKLIRQEEQKFHFRRLKGRNLPALKRKYDGKLLKMT